jgi:hypothetical protein
MQVLPKPWFNLEAYKKIRLEEARFEVEIAEKFLQEGLIRNAAGKAFQAWKSLLAALLTEKRDVLVKKYPKEVVREEKDRIRRLDNSRSSHFLLGRTFVNLRGRNKFINRKSSLYSRIPAQRPG